MYDKYKSTCLLQSGCFLYAYKCEFLPRESVRGRRRCAPRRGSARSAPLRGADNAALRAARRRVADGLAKNEMSFGTQNSPRQAPAFSHSVRLSFFVTDFGLSKLTFLLLMLSCKNSPFLMCQSIGRRI